MTVAPTYIIYIPSPNTHSFTNHHGGAHDSDIPDFSPFQERHRSHDFRAGHKPQITRSPPQRPQMENDRRTEHSATEEEEEVHFHYQSRRGRCTLWTPLFLHTTNHHGGAAKTHSSLDTPYSYYQSPRGRH